jgi:hypothetical protein
MATPQLGAHVQIDNETENYWYIIPLCLKHSISATSLEIDDATVLVSAHVIENCGKQMPIGNIQPQDLPATIATNPMMHEQEKAKAQDLRGRSDTEMLRVYGKPKVRREEPPALGLMY